MLPMIFTMCIAFFVVHGSDHFAVKELAFIYLVVFILLYIACLLYTSTFSQSGEQKEVAIDAAGNGNIEITGFTPQYVTCLLYTSRCV